MVKDPNDIYGRKWILENAIPIVESYHGNITIRQLHYRLVSIGMINDDKHYARDKTFKVSADAVQETISYINAALDKMVGEIYAELKDEGRKTIKPRDIIRKMDQGAF